jgi:catechol 2,3-dioxygenase-like lactoylglutathione lyase family enzyme
VSLPSLVEVEAAAADIDAAVAAWARGAGLTPSEPPSTAGGAALSAANAALQLRAATGHDGLLSLTLAVDDLDAAVQRLRDVGVEVELRPDGILVSPASSHGVPLRLVRRV